MKKIKVIHIITKLELGGAQKNTLYTVSNLNKNYFDVMLVCGKGGILDDETKEALGDKVIFIEELVREISPLKDIKALLRLKKILDVEKPDIIHTHSSKAGILARTAGFLAGVRVIIHTYHGFGFNDYQNFFVKNFYIITEKITSLFTDFFIFVSKANLKTALRYGLVSKKKSTVIRSGIKISDFSRKKDRSFAISIFPEITEKSKIIVTVANLKPQKNPEDFINIASELINSKRDVYFIYAGGGSDYHMKFYTDLIKKYRIEKRCIITGWIYEVKNIYQSADIFLLTSLWEGLPRSLVEAVASGVVPVCYRTDGVEDIISDGVNGFLVPKLDFKKASDVLKLLVDDEKLYSKIKKNVELTDLSEFDIDYMVRQQEKLYFDLIK